MNRSTCASYDRAVLDVNDDPAGDFWLCEGPPSTPRMHIALTAVTLASVDRFYRTALALGASCNGAPGYRPQYHARYYAAYVFDLDGYPMEAVCHHSL